MAIVSALVEADGWIVAVRLQGSISAYAASPDTAAQAAANFASYPMAAVPANTAPILAVGGVGSANLSCTSNGFTVSAGQCVVATPARNLVVTVPLRKPVVATDAGVRAARKVDETDNGDGTITVRLALSNHVYATDTGLSLIVAAGWRTGSGAQTIAVTNNSTVAAPDPIVRWADVPRQLQAGSFDLEVVVAGHHPSGLAPAAGVKFTVYDNVTLKSYWSTALSPSTKYQAGGTGLPLWVYKVTVDPTTATALTQGLLRCDYKVFPWIGPARVSDTADTNLTTVASNNPTPSMTTLGTATLTDLPQSPFAVAYSPLATFVGSISGTVLTVTGFSGYPLGIGSQIAGASLANTVISALGTGTGGNGTYTVQSQTTAATPMIGAWIVQRYVDVDETNGAQPVNNNDGTNIGLITITADPNASGMGPSKSVNGAMIACFAYNFTVAAANGQVAITRSTDGLHIRIRKANAGTGCTGILTTTGPNAVTSGTSTGATWVMIEGDPTDANPRANCIWRAGGYAITRATATRFTRMRLEANAANIHSTVNSWMDDVDLTAQAGQSATSNAPIVGVGVHYLSNMAWFGHGSGPTLNGANYKPVFSRNCTSDRSFGAPLCVNNARLFNSAVPSATASVGSNTSPTTLVGMSIDRIILGNDFRRCSGGFTISMIANASAPANLTLGTAYMVGARHAFINNTVELIGASGVTFASAGENIPCAASQNIIEGNTGTGDRFNSFYNDLNLATVDLNDSENNRILVNRVANNVMTKMASKHDDYNDQSFVKPQRVGVSLSSTRNKAYAVGVQVVIAGSPVSIYESTASTGNTASTGGPTGTGQAIVDGGVTWKFIHTEARQHGYRPQATGAWSSHYGVGYHNNLDLQPASVSNSDFFWEFMGVGSLQMSKEGLEPTTSPFTLDKSGTNVGLGQMPWLLPWDSANTGGGDYRPLRTGTGTYLQGKGKAASVPVDQAGVARTPGAFAIGSLEPAALAFLGFINATMTGVG